MSSPSRRPDVAGALTDAAAGIAIDLVDAAARTAQRGAAKAADAVSGHLPDAIDRTKEVATRATHVVADKAPDVAGALTDAAAGIAIDLVDASARTALRGAAEAADAVSGHLPDAIDKSKEVATRATHVVADKAPDVAESAKKTGRAALDATRDWASSGHSSTDTPSTERSLGSNLSVHHKPNIYNFRNPQLRSWVDIKILKVKGVIRARQRESSR